MENNLPVEKEPLKVSTQELITRFVDFCKFLSKDCKEGKSIPLCTADIVTAVYYYRKHQDVNEFLTKYITYNQDYFQIQWIRSMWSTFQNMTAVELSDLVINQITSVDNSTEGL